MGVTLGRGQAAAPASPGPIARLCVRHEANSIAPMHCVNVFRKLLHVERLWPRIKGALRAHRTRETANRLSPRDLCARRPVPLRKIDFRDDFFSPTIDIRVLDAGSSTQ